MESTVHDAIYWFNHLSVVHRAVTVLTYVRRIKKEKKYQTILQKESLEILRHQISVSAINHYHTLQDCGFSDMQSVNNCYK